MRRTFVFRLYPTRRQAELLDAQLHATRGLYNAALEGRVHEVEQVVLPHRGDVVGPHYPFESKRIECVQYYGLKITTDKGRAMLDYRNDSNGYYGGSLELGK